MGDDVFIRPIEYNPKKCGDRIRVRLEEMGKSQHWLARNSDVLVCSVNKIITGKTKNPSVNAICKILPVIGMTFEQLTRE